MIRKLPTWILILIANLHDFILLYLFIACAHIYSFANYVNELFAHPSITNYVNKITSINLSFDISYWIAEIIILIFIIFSVLFKNTIIKNIFLYYEIVFAFSILIFSVSTISINDLNNEFYVFWQFILSFFFVGYIYILTTKLEYEQNKTSVEFFYLIFGSLLAVFLLIKASNLFLLWFILEFLSLLSYAISYCSNNYNNKASFYYFIFNSIAGAIMLLSISCILKILPANTEIDYNVLNYFLGHSDNVLISSFFIFFFMSGFFIKLGIFPFHFWNIDVYTNVSNRILFFFIIINKLALFLVLYKLVYIYFSNCFTYLYYFFCTLAIISSIVASFQLVKTYELNKFIALTSLVQSGYIVAGICTNVPVIGKISLMYLLIYIFLMLLLFGNLSFLKYEDKSIINIQSIKNISEFKYLFALIIFSLIGVPPFILFFLKFQLFQFFGFNNFLSLLLSFLLISIFTCFYYLKFLNANLFKSNIYTKKNTSDTNNSDNYEDTWFFSIDEYFILNFENIVIKYLNDIYIINVFSYIILFCMSFIIPFFYFNVLNNYSFFKINEQFVAASDINLLLNS